ncbi:MAG TPA: hypothetical protein VHZ32_00185 [Rhizomicrobium sp.]|nr:hypothetical protein [Rhizomicrobium sp.]
MATDRTFRSLAALSTASTSRVLNLLAITRSHGENKEFIANAMFSSPMLNNAIILKHRLRADEVDLMQSSRCIGTKVIIPFEKTDLRSGGKSLIVGQKGYEEMLREAGHYGERYDFDHDVKVLRLLDQIPSLDPFLLREHLRTNDVYPDAHYFEISDADQKRMFEYAAAEIRRLTNMAVTPGSSGKRTSDATTRMVSALLSTEVDEKLEPLRTTLQLQPGEFREGVFSWRGFIYYKWSLVDFWPDLVRALSQLKTIVPLRTMDIEQRAYITQAKQTILTGAKKGSNDIKNIIRVYDNAYDTLIAERDPRKFREFLLGAPALFLEIGEKMGALSHITSFWKYRFPEGAPRSVDCEELTAIFQDFSKGFSLETRLAAA